MNTILLLEDNLLDAELIEAQLRAHFPCDVRVVVTRKAYFEELQRKLPDLILSDSNLAGYDGLSALAFAATRCSDVPFVFCSGNMPLEQKAEALSKGAVACVSKNDPSRLIEVVGQLLPKQ